MMRKRLKRLMTIMMALIISASLGTGPVYAAGIQAAAVGDGGGFNGGSSGPGNDMGGGSSSSGAPDSYDAVVEYTETQTVSGITIESTGTDENAVLVATDGITVTLDEVTISRISDDSTGGDDASFYGIGAAALVTAGTLIIDDSSIYGNGNGAAGVFSYSDGIAYVSDTAIETVQDTSGGIHVAGGGTLYAWDLTVVTAGGSSAAIRSDRGGGTIVVDGGSYTSNGTGSPAIYSAGDITVNNAKLTANASEAICMEGLNSIRLYDCDLSGSMADDSQNDCTWNIILYQSQSGDAEEGNAYFEMVGGSITAENGGMFYTTNTESTYVISDVDITYADDSEFVIKCTGNSNSRGWGSTGSNGADCSFTAINQQLEGAVIWDSISMLDLYLTDGSTLTGYAVDDESNAGSGGSGYADIIIDETSSWIVTADSTVSNLYVSGTIADESGNTVSVVGTDGTVYVSGTSAYTITVDSYTAQADTSGASQTHSFSDYAVTEPESSQDNDDDNSTDDGTADDGSTDDGLADDGTVDDGTTDDGTTDDGSTDDGTTNDGTTDDGTTDDGTTDDGTTDDGTTDDGTTDDGTTDDGSANDGTTDDGSADDGTTDDGTTDDGSADDGTTDDGSADDGTTDSGTSDDTSDALIDISSASASLSFTTCTYNGNVQKPSVTVTIGDTTLENGTDYTVTYDSGCKNAGTYAVTITGIGNYTGSAKTSFTISAQSLVTSNVTLSASSYTYNGSARKPSVTVKNSSGTVLTEGTDYTVSYASGRKNVGTYKVKITGTGNYTGTVTKTFTIKAQTLSSSKVSLSKTSYTYNGSARKPSVTVKNSSGTTLTKGTDYTVSYASGRKNVGTYKVKITGTGNYTGTVTKTFTIKAQTLSSSKVSLSKTSYTYNGSARKPSVTVKNSSGTTLTKGTDYTVSYASGRKSIGTYKVKITGTGNYTGTITKTFTIKPGKTTISSAKSSSAKKLTVKWKKVSGSVKYQIAYKKKGSSVWTYKTVSASTYSKTLSSLTSGKTYYVKVRAYKKVSGKTYYGSWSSTKTVKVK